MKEEIEKLHEELNAAKRRTRLVKAYKAADPESTVRKS